MKARFPVFCAGFLPIESGLGNPRVLAACVGAIYCMEIRPSLMILLSMTNLHVIERVIQVANICLVCSSTRLYTGDEMSVVLTKSHPKSRRISTVYA